MLTEREAASAGPRTTKQPGSVAWCWQTLDFFRRTLQHVDQQFRQADEILDELVRVEAWKTIPPESPYGSLRRLLAEEVGLDYKQVRAKIQTAAERFADTGPATPHGTNRYTTVPRAGATRSRNERNTAEDYVARLKRDAKDNPAAAALLDDVMADRTAPTAAAEQMGWRKTRILLTSPESVAERIREHFTAEQIAQLVALLMGIETQGGDR